MHETGRDLEALQALLDTSREGSGRHLRDVFADGLGLSATELAGHLTGVRVLSVATVSSGGEPIVAPVDGVFHRGSFHFGSAPDSVRVRHLAARPAVSATYVEGERLAVVVHGRAARIAIDDPAERGFRDCLVEVYAPRYGPGWIDWAAASAVYFRIEARRLYASRLPGSEAPAIDTSPDDGGRH